VIVGVGVTVGVGVGVGVAVGVGVGDGVGEAVGVAVGVGVGVAVVAFVKHVVTSFSVGVTELLLVVKNARYLRYLCPLNCASETPLVVKKVPAVPSGPT
jgi:hypothetical protein